MRYALSFIEAQMALLGGEQKFNKHSQKLQIKLYIILTSFIYKNGFITLYIK